MITGLRLTNFKAWRETGTIGLRALTVLLGSNSSGKSSLGHSLLLLRQTVSPSGTEASVTLRGDQGANTIDFGEFSDVLHHRADNVDRFVLGVDVEDQQGAFSLDVSYQRAPDASLRLTYRWSPANDQNRAASPTFGPRLNEQLRNICYLGPWRQRSLREYPAQNLSAKLPAIDGQGFAALLIHSALATNAPAQALLQGVSHWLQRLQLAQGIAIEPAPQSGYYQLRLQRDGRCVNLADAGIGVAYILPVLVLALCAPAGSTVIVEEPEIHLHPLAQAVLADLFAEIHQQRQVQFIVETHSEHLFRRLLTLIARQQLMASQLAIYHVEQQQGNARLRALQLDDFGRVLNWPAGLFGDALGETREQARLMFERQQGQQR